MPLGASRIAFLARSQVTVVAEVIRKKVGVSAQGNAQVDTAQSKFGGASALFDGTGDYLQIADNDNWDLTSTAWTIEGWIRSDTVSSGIKTVIGKRSNSVTSGWFIYINNTDFVFNAIGITTIATASAAISANTWHHFAVTRDGNDYEIFIDGTSSATTTDSSTIITNSDSLLIGRDITNTGRDWDGYIDELRISDTVRYTTGFTPSTTPFVNDDNTLLLLHMDGTDASTFFNDDNGVRRAYDLEFQGNAVLDTSTYKFGGSSLSLPAGTNDKAVGALSQDFNVGTGEFTIECWANLDATTDERLISFRVPNANQTYEGGLVLRVNGGKLEFSNGEAWYAGTTTISTGTWYHFAASRDSSGDFRLFVNGNLERTDDGSAWNFQYDDRQVVIGAIIENNSITVDGHIDEVRFSTVARYTAAFTSPTAPFVNDDNTLVLYHFDGTDGEQYCLDDNGKGRSQVGASAEGNAQVDTAVTKIGDGSLYLDGVSDALQVQSQDFNFSHTDEFTIETWVRVFAGGDTYKHIFSVNWPDSTDYGFTLIRDNSARFAFYWSTDGSTTTSINGSAVSNDTWYHVAITCDGSGNLKLWQDGVNVASSSSTTMNVSSSGNFPRIGATSANLTGGNLSGYIDELRVSDTVRYTTGFTPSTEPFQNDANTLLLLHMDGTDGSTVFIDDNGTYTE